MTLHVTVSTKGQIVVPKTVRDRLGILPGSRLEMVERPDGVLFRRPIDKKSTKSTEEILAEMRALADYHGPPVSIEEMDQALADMWAKGGPRWDE